MCIQLEIPPASYLESSPASYLEFFPVSQLEIPPAPYLEIPLHPDGDPLYPTWTSPLHPTWRSPFILPGTPPASHLQLPLASQLGGSHLRGVPEQSKDPRSRELGASSPSAHGGGSRTAESRTEEDFPHAVPLPPRPFWGRGRCNGGGCKHPAPGLAEARLHAPALAAWLAARLPSSTSSSSSSGPLLRALAVPPAGSRRPAGPLPPVPSAVPPFFPHLFPGVMPRCRGGSGSGPAPPGGRGRQEVSGRERGR